MVKSDNLCCCMDCSFILSLEMISRASSIENVIGVILITWVVLAAATTKGFTSYKFKREREYEK